MPAKGLVISKINTQNNSGLLKDFRKFVSVDVHCQLHKIKDGEQTFTYVNLSTNCPTRGPKRTVEADSTTP
jgi:hypothetical protein